MKSFHKLRRRLRIWWLSITTPDSPITVTLERGPYHNVEFFYDCPECDTRHEFTREFERNPSYPQCLWSGSMDITNRGTHIEIKCFECGYEADCYYTEFAQNYTDKKPYTHRLRISDHET